MNATTIAEREPALTPRSSERPSAALDMPSVGMVLGIGFLVLASVVFIAELPDLIRYMRIRRM